MVLFKCKTKALKYVTVVVGIFLMTLTQVAGAESSIQRTCNTVVKAPEKAPEKTQIEIVIESGVLKSHFTNSSGTRVQISRVVEQDVRVGLTEDSDPRTLNEVEKMIVHAMILSRDPVFNGMFDAGVDLNLVHSAKVFYVGDSSKYGAPAVVVAFDADKKELGSFFGGLTLSACDK